MTPSAIRRLASLVLLGLLLASSAVPPVDAAEPRTGGAPQAADHVPYSGPRGPERERVLDFWTPERFAAAVPPPGIERQGSPSEDSPERIRLANGPAGVVDGNFKLDPPEDPRSFTVPGYGAGTPALTYPYAYNKTGAPDWFRDRFPWSAYGRIFFTNAAYGGGTFSCSGTSVASGTGGNENLVLTAAHCLNSGGSSGTPGTWSTDVVFVPAYRNGTGLWGEWTYLSGWIWGDWLNYADDTYDYGFLTLVDNAYGPLSDTTGAQGIAWNQPDHQVFWNFGYPVTSPYNGTALSICMAPTALRDSSVPGAGEAPLGMGCDFTGGSSGGGWMLAFRQKYAGYVNSVNTYKYTGQAAMYGPYFDGDIVTLWDLARIDVPPP